MLLGAVMIVLLWYRYICKTCGVGLFRHTMPERFWGEPSHLRNPGRLRRSVQALS